MTTTRMIPQPNEYTLRGSRLSIRRTHTLFIWRKCIGRESAFAGSNPVKLVTLIVALEVGETSETSRGASSYRNNRQILWQLLLVSEKKVT
jgi:hypothetical protein